ncbi:MAG: hypothetical protein IJE43_02980 [Alphaproteobacteria bacterium]|nr:hypothetical protein [Alphaproteobacteria bacterium]MBQ6886271.1 hypothetical protein [Lachnospiraceae bacterium]
MFLTISSQMKEYEERPSVCAGGLVTLIIEETHSNLPHISAKIEQL